MSDHKWLLSKSPYDIALEIVEDHESAVVVAHVQKALYSEEATNIFLRSYVNVLRGVVSSGGDKAIVERLEKWDKVDVDKALELGKGLSFFYLFFALLGFFLSLLLFHVPSLQTTVANDFPDA